MADIIVQIPFDGSGQMNLGRACNEAMERVPDGGYGVLLDHDIHLTTPHWFAQIQEAIACRPDAGAFCVVTNRIASPWQRAAEIQQNCDSLETHYRVGEQRRAVRTLLDVTCTKGYGAVLQVVNKEAWRECGGFANGTLLCCDHSLFFGMKAKGRRIFMIEGLYVLHRRVTSSARHAVPLPKWEACPCRGTEQQPTERIAL